MQSIFFRHYLTQGDQVMKATLTTAKGFPIHISIYGALCIVVALLLRGGIVALQPYYRTYIYFLDVGVIVYFGLPLLELVTLIAASWHVSPRTERIVRFGQFLLPVLIINAAWRVIEYFQTETACEITSGGYHEAFCESLGMQVFVHVPFLILATIALFLFHREIDISHLYKKWAFVIGAALLLRVIFFLPGYFAANNPFFPLFVFNALMVFGFPVLATVTLIAASLRVSYRTERIVRVGQFLLPVLMIHAAWRIFEYVPLYFSSEILRGGDLAGRQLIANVPFLILATIALVRFHRKVG